MELWVEFEDSSELDGEDIDVTYCAHSTADMLGQSMRTSDMYLKELKAYKTPPVKANDAEGQVQKFSLPKPPTSPEEADIANDLKAYEDQVPEVEGQAVAGSAGAPEEDWFEDPEDEADAPSGAAH
ncbi:ATP synthase F0 subcomplex subunit H atp14 [Friedmanniomyces endolithicus]|nr:ATP synthase F0 subcomplex subunit H atp14 [Friedmanniomyces endolithicus]